MTINANSAGVVAGKFTIPAGILAGRKNVSLSGAGGSHGEAVFIGQGSLQTNTTQRVTTIETNRFDPLAQTFSLSSESQIGGVDLWFSAKGPSQVVVQIRETTAGSPNQIVLAESRLLPAGISLSAETRFPFPFPVSLQKGSEYAIVVMCNDAVSALSVAELGKWDSTNSQWVTSQPYQVGVLLSSSNASSWTAHQDKDLAFRLLAANYTSTSRSVALGSIPVTAATDLMLLALTDTPSANAFVNYTLGLPDESNLTVAAGQPVRLSSAITGDVSVTAVLQGTSTASPVLYPGSQLVSGQVSTSATYVTRAIPAGTAARVRVIFDALIPAGASVAVAAAGVDVGDTYQSVPYVSATPLGDGWMEMEHELASITEASVHLKLTLGGTTAARPRVRNLRVIII
jgi:hypothetical protein